jgi:hypothetical protein
MVSLAKPPRSSGFDRRGSDLIRRITIRRWRRLAGAAMRVDPRGPGSRPTRTVRSPSSGPGRAHARAATSGGAPASFADLELGGSVLSADGTGTTEMARATDLGHQDRRSSHSDSVQPGEADGCGGANSGERARLKQGARP